MEGSEEQEHAEHEAEVAAAVDDEGFFACVGGRFSEEVKADKQVAGQSDALPADEKKNVVRGEDQNQHEEHKEVEVGEEAVVAAFVGHVSSGVDVNEEADAGDDEDHDDGELVHLEVEAGAEVAGDNPVEEFLAENLAGGGDVGYEFAYGFERECDRKSR